MREVDRPNHVEIARQISATEHLPGRDDRQGTVGATANGLEPIAANALAE